MKRFLIIIGALVTISIYAQNDTTLSRIVTVERDFQPVIQSAGKINTRPTIISHELQLNPVVYSTYSTPLAIGYNVNQLPAAETRFIPQAPLQGILEGAGGYRNSHFQFGYRINQKKKMSLNLYANHNAYWGVDTYSKSQLGMLVTAHFSGADFYVGIEGNNDYYSYFGRYFDGINGLGLSSMSHLQSHDWQTLWQANAKIGVCSNKKAPVQYRIQTGYAAFIATNYAIEHQVRSHLDLAWSNQYHGAGVKVYVQNNFYTHINSQLSLASSATTHHAIRVEPFYSFQNTAIRLHAGVNIDMNIGNGELLSTVKNLSFAPSPNLNFEWRMMDDIFHVYANAKGQFGIGSVEEYLNYNPYLNIAEGLSYRSPRAYTPVDAQVGFKIRPMRTLLIDLYGGYAYQMNANIMQASIDTLSSTLPSAVKDYHLAQTSYQYWKAGAAIHLHIRDIVEIDLSGNYYFYQPAAMPIYDRPNWDAYGKLKINIDSKWSLYSENYFAGSRLAYTTQGDKQLKPTISLNIGGQYAINRWLITYLQVNNYLNRKNDIFYGYQEQGIHFLLGLKYKF